MHIQTGTQVHIGNGSFLMLNGVSPIPKKDQSDFDTFDLFVHFIAQMRCQENDAFPSEKYIREAHAATIWNDVCLNTIPEEPREHCFMTRSPEIDNPWIRIHFAEKIQAPLRSPRGFLDRIGGSLEKYWDIVQYAEVEPHENEILDVTFQEIQPTDIRLWEVHCPVKILGIRQKSWSPVSLGFESPEVDRVAFALLMMYRNQGNWGGFPEDSFLEALGNGGFVDRILQSSPPLSDALVREALDALIHEEFIAYKSENELREYPAQEKFVIHMWRRSLRLPEELYPKNIL